MSSPMRQGHSFWADHKADLTVWRRHLPAVPVIKSLLASAGDKGLIPGLGRFHMLSRNKACVPKLLKPLHSGACAQQQEKPSQREACTPQRRVAPALHDRKKACVQQRRPSIAVNKLTRKPRVTFWKILIKEATSQSDK